MFGPFAAVWLEAMKLSPHDPATGILVALGIDGSRPIAIAVLGVSDEQRGTIDALVPLLSTDVPGRTTEAARRIVASIETIASFRALVPTSDRARLRAAIGAYFEQAQSWQPQGPTNYRRVVDGSETARVELGGDDRTMVLDVAYGRAARDAIAAMHEQLRHGHADPPELESRTARVTYSPAALADLGFLAGVVEAESAARSVDPTQRARMIAGQLGIVRDALALARTDKGVIFDRVELGITDDDAKLEVTVSAEPGPAFVRIPDEVWIPSTTVTAADGKEAYDISRALLGAWPLPTECRDPLAPGEAVRCDFDVNEAPYLVALPHLFALSALAVTNSHQSHAALADRHEEEIVPPAVSLPRFQRLGYASVFTDSPGDIAVHEIFVGLLPENTARTAAECVLANSAPCSGPSKLTLGAVVDLKGVFARLVEFEHRFVVLFARTRAPLNVKLATRTIGAGSVELSDSVQRRLFGGMIRLPAGLVGTVGTRGKAIVFRVTSP